MHYINNDDKNRQAIQRFLVYGLMGLIIFGLTYLLVLVARGYDIDRTTGQVINNGLLLIETEPRGAQIYIDGLQERSKSPAQLPLPEGKYGVRLEKEGYRLWSNDIGLIGSQVTWLYYPRLIPNLITTSSYADVVSMQIADASPSGDRMVSSAANTTNPTLEIYDIRSESSLPTQLALAPLLTPDSEGSYGAVSLSEWSNNERHVLLRHQHAELTEFVLVNTRSTADSLNLSSLFEAAPGQVVLGRDANVLFSLTGRSVRAHNISDQTARIVAANVDAMYVDENNWLYVLQNGASRVSRSLNDGGVFTTLLSDANNYHHLDSSSFEGDQYVALGRDALEVALYRNIDDSLVSLNTPEKIITMQHDVSDVTFSRTGRLLLVQSEFESRVFDLAQNRELHVQRDDLTGLGWLGEARLYGFANGSLFIMDFDGANKYEIVSASNEFPPFVDEAEQFLYSTARSAPTAQTYLQQSNLLADD